MIPQKANSAEDFVRGASPLASESQLQEVAKRMRRWKCWLPMHGQYYNNVTDKVKGNADIDGPALGEYIACSAPLHLMDGWSYLSRAFDAAAHGDRTSAYHLAYYAELRAAISLLATEGIGIFRRYHIALNDRLEPTVYSMQTHRATWCILSAWTREKDTAVRLLQAITVDSKPLSEWLEAVGVVKPALKIVAQQWLSTWGIDLRILATDSQRRNEVSYRPTRIQSQKLLPIDPQLEYIDPLFNSWSALEPTMGKASALLDLSLLRQALKLVIRKDLCHYASFDSAAKSLKGSMSTFMHEELLDQDAGAAKLFRDAEKKSTKGKLATPILARGLLMLRLASAATALLLDAAGVSKSDLEFWWSPLGTDFGLWENPEDIEEFRDLWIDVEESRDEVEVTISDIQGVPSVKDVAKIFVRDLALTQFTRAPMWLLGLD